MPVLLAIGSASAQTPVSASDKVLQLLSDLSRQVHELRIEVVTLRLARHEHRMQRLEEQIRGAENDRRLAEYEDNSARNEILAIEGQLASSDLDAEGRAELTGLKNVLLTQGQPGVQQRRKETAERESALREEWERERAFEEEFRRTLKTLRAGTPAASPSKPEQ